MPGCEVRTLALIPARAGSKGIKNKNLRDFNGRPLVAWAIAVGRVVADDTIVSTDSDEIAAMAARCGAGILQRPSFLATDEASMFDVVLHATMEIPVGDVILLLQPTQPLRTSEHVRAAKKLLTETGADSVVSVVEIPAHYSPDYAVRINHPMLPGPRVQPYIDRSTTFRAHYGGQVLAPMDGLDAMPRARQECDKAYSRDGTVYAIRRKTIENGSLYGDKCVPLIIPSHESVNLDTEEDWQRAEAMVSR